MDKHLGYFIMALLFQFVISGDHDAECVMKSEDKNVCIIKIACPADVDIQAEKLKKAIEDTVKKCTATSDINFDINLMITDENFPDIGEKWSNVKKIEMTNVGLKKVPSIVFGKASNLEDLDLSYNKIETLEGINIFSKLKTLKLANNILDFAVDLSDFKNLHTIDFSHNNISILNTPAIDVDKELRNIYLSHNRIKYIPDGFFVKCLKLDLLDLSNNRIHEISMGQTQNLCDLKNLILSHNYLSSIGNGFHKLDKLEKLLLDFNSISSISSDTFVPMKDLKVVNLTFNNINQLSESAFKDLKKLEELYLGNNNISKITKKLLEKNRNLEKLDVSFNKVEIIESHAFTNNKIKELKFQGNRLKGAIDETMFKGLLVSELDLSDGGITEIRDQCFTSLVNLRQLNLNNNNISLISKTALKNSVNFVSLNISHNNLVDLEFIDVLENLETLDASFNQINHDIPIKNTKSLTYLDLSYNSISNIVESLKLYLNKLTHFKCSHCSLANIDKEMFKNTEKLQYLDLSFNSIQQSEFLEKLTINLEELYLNNNQLQNIDSISKLVNLKVLNCSSNNIEIIKVNTFSEIPRLNSIDLSYNTKLSISEHFNYPLQLETVKIGNIKKVFLKNIESSIKNLDLSSTNVESLDEINLNKTKNLEVLNLKYNKISSLKNNSLVSMYLKEIDLGGNNIVKIEDDAFRSVPKMRKIILSKNKIIALDKKIFSELRDLEILNLSNNQIRSINHSIFESNTKLSELDLQGNKIDFISDDAFSGLSLMKKLYLSNNNLTSFVSCLVPKYVTELEIDMSQNSLQNFPFREFRNKGIKQISLKGNPIPCETFTKALATFTDLNKILKHNYSDYCINNTQSTSTIASPDASITSSDLHTIDLSISTTTSPLNTTVSENNSGVTSHNKLLTAFVIVISVSYAGFR